MSPITDPKHLERLLERQARLFEMRRRHVAEGEEAARRKLVHLPEGPWITLSKQMGSGGEALAKALAETLGWQVYDREILESIARETHIRDPILSRLDGRAVGVLEEYLAHLFVPDDPGQAVFVREMARVVGALARQGQAVLVGRGANWLLDPRFGLRIRVVRPLEQRVARVAERGRMASPEARRRVLNDDETQADFIRQVYRRDINDPLGYDLVVNLASLDPGSAVETAVTALRAKLGVAPAS